jgi:hypothetical protein
MLLNIPAFLIVQVPRERYGYYILQHLSTESDRWMPGTVARVVWLQARSASVRARTRLRARWGVAPLRRVPGRHGGTGGP